MVELFMRLQESYAARMFFPDPVIKAGAPTGEINITENGLYNVEDYATANVAVPEPIGTINITENGDYNVASYATAHVAVPEPSETINITENGDYNVSSYASAHVAVPEPSGNININENGVIDVTDYQTATVTQIGKTALKEETITIVPESNLEVLTFNHHLGVIPQYIHLYTDYGSAPNSTTIEWHMFRLNTQVENVDFQLMKRKASNGIESYTYIDRVYELTDTTISVRFAAGGSYFRAGLTYTCKCFGNIIIGSETDVSQ